MMRISLGEGVVPADLYLHRYLHPPNTPFEHRRRRTEGRGAESGSGVLSVISLRAYFFLTYSFSYFFCPGFCVCAVW